MGTSPVARAIPFILLLALSAAIFLGGLGRLPLLGRDESLYGEAAREMLASGDWVTPRVNGGAFFEKPPLYYWMAAASYRVFGVSPFAARLPAALMGVLTVMLTAAIGGRAWGRRAGLLAGLALVTCLQMAIIGRMGIMDMPLTCLTLLAVLACVRGAAGGPLLLMVRRSPGEPLVLLWSPWSTLAFGLCLGLGVLLKGLAGAVPLAVVVVFTLVYSRPWLGGEHPGDPHRFSQRRLLRYLWPFGVPVAVAAVIAAPWFVVMASRHGAAFSGTFLLHEHWRRIVHPMQGHGGPVWYYVALIAVSFFPWVVFLPGAVASLRQGVYPDKGLQERWYRLCLVWIAVVLVPFSLVRTKLPGYVTPLFPPMALLVGAYLDRLLRDLRQRAEWKAVIVGAVALGALAFFLPDAGARLGSRVGAAQEARLLVGPVTLCMVGYGVVATGGVASVLWIWFRPRMWGAPNRLALRLLHWAWPLAEVSPVALLAAGQMVILGAILLGVLPVISPYLEGGREYRLAQQAKIIEHARRQDAARMTMLYDTRPEAVAFVLGHPVPAFGRDRQDELLAELRAGPALLITPVKDSGLPQEFAVEEVARVGNRVLLDVRPGLRAYQTPERNTQWPP